MSVSILEKTNDSVTLSMPLGRARISTVDDSIIHVVYAKAEQFGEKPSMMVVPRDAPGVKLEVNEAEDVISLRVAKLQLQVSRSTGAFTWLDSRGEVLVREPASGGKTLEPIAVEKRIFDASIKIKTESTVDGTKARVENAKVVIDRQAFSTRLDLVFSPGEAIYGLGQHEEGILNYRGRCQYLYQQNMKKAMPIIVSTRGYGILWDTTSLGVFHDDVYGSYFWTEVDDEMDFYVIAGPEFDEIVAGIRKLTGKSALFPRWTFGYVQSKERYRTQQELIDVVAEFRRRKIPLDCIVQDWLTWKGKWWGDKNPDPERFPDISKLTAELHAMNAKLMVSIWPIMRGESPNQIEMREHGFLLGNDATYNAFDADARDLYWKQANQGWWKHGIDAWWCDCTEPFEADWKGGLKPEPWKRVFINTGESKTYLDPERINAYSLHHSRGIYEHQRKVTSDKRVVNLTRSGFPGQQRYGAITWSGDIAANWKTLRQQIADGLNFCVTGNPKWTLDIGAFFVAKKEQWFWRGDYPNGCDDPGYRELYTRWIQFGAFLPMMRSHGTDTPREPWRFGQPGDAPYDTIVKFIQLRYRLLPYIYSLAAMETRGDYTMLRMLAFDFRNDPKVYDIADQYMFGPAIMVCPVTEAGAKYRSVYLPAGSDWYDFWTGRCYPGGQSINASCPLEIMPLFVRGGSILPMGPIVQHSGEALGAPMELRVYGGAGARFTLYEDEGDNYKFERGQFTNIPIEWNEHEHRLTIGPRGGAFDGMIARREFLATRVVEGRGVGIESTAHPDHVIVCGAPFQGEARWE